MILKIQIESFSELLNKYQVLTQTITFYKIIGMYVNVSKVVTAMKLNYLKYFNLLKKDFLLTKNILFIVIYFFVLMGSSVFFFKNNINNYLPNLISTITLLEMIAFGSHQVLTSEKCKGNEILITTTYTRKNIVLSRYLFFYISFFTIMIASFFASIFISPILLNYYVMIEDLLMICVGISILTFFTFKINNNLVYNVVAFIFMSPILAIINTFEMINCLMGPYVFCIFLFFLSILSTIITFNLSKKIYINKSF